MRRPARVFLFVGCLAALLTECASPPAQSSAGIGGNPDQAAWDVFTRINQPAQDGLASVWENWVLAGDLFTEWPASPKWPSTPSRVKRLEIQEQNKLLLEFASKEPGNMKILRPPIDTTANSEVHFNCSTFRTVMESNLWNTNGLMNRAAAIAAGTAKAIQFLPDSIAVKAKWRQYNPSKDDLTHYHSASDAQGMKWVLIGLHITSKIQPNWLWATWEHMDNTGRQPSGDTFGFPNGTSAPSRPLTQMFQQNHLRGEWQYYRLDGTQTDFFSPKILGNSTLETHFLESSSCITCHDRAGRFSDNSRLSFLDPQGNGFVGNPLTSWFTASGKSFMATDFLWSMAARANQYGLSVQVAPLPDCSKIQ